MRNIMLLTAFVLFAININAQTKRKTAVKRYLFHSHGISFQNFDNLNNRIKAYPQYEQLKNTTGTLQFGIFTQYDRLIIGYSGNFGNSLSGNKNKKSSSIKFSGASIDLGYSVFKTARFSLYPYAGLGYERFKAIFNKDISTVPFDSTLTSNSVLQNTERPVFTNTFAVYRVGFGAFLNSKKRSQNSFGLQVGYSGSFGEKDWKINNTQTLLNSPKDKLSKIAVSLLIRYELKRNN